MSLVYIGVSEVSVKANRPEYFEYALVGINGNIALVRDISKATKYKTEKEAIEDIYRTSIWVAEYDGETVKPLQPTR